MYPFNITFDKLSPSITLSVQFQLLEENADLQASVAATSLAAFMKLARIPHTASIEQLSPKGPHPGVETPDTPDVVDEADAGDVVERVVMSGWRRPHRVRRVVN